jgi:hypothetical protein
MVRKTTKPLRALRITKLEVLIFLVFLSVLCALVLDLSNRDQPLAKYLAGKVFQGFNAETQRIREARKGVSPVPHPVPHPQTPYCLLALTGKKKPAINSRLSPVARPGRECVCSLSNSVKKK